MVEVWIGLLGVAIVLWFALRWTYRRLLTKWRIELGAAEALWDRELWDTSQQGARATKARMQHLVREVFDEVARPLEPYVVVFMLCLPFVRSDVPNQPPLTST